MAKYNNFQGPYRLTRARIEHICDSCGNVILPGTDYWKEWVFLRFLQRPPRKLCDRCHAVGKEATHKDSGTSTETKGPLDKFL